MKQITFTKVNLAELIDAPVKEMGAGDVRVRTEFSTVSCGTERANITDSLGGSASRNSKVHFPHTLGYSTSGIVEAVGEAVTSLKVGERVMMYWSTHSQYNVLPAHQVVKIEDDRISMQEAALSFIATFPMAAIRKTRLEMGESVLIMGQGLLGLLAVKLARLAGGCPIVAVDPVAERRELALQYGTLKESDWHGGTMIAGEVTPEFARMILSLPKPTDREIYNKMTPFFDVWLDDDFQSCHYGTENYI